MVLCHWAEEDDAFSFVNWFSVLLGKYVFKDVKKSQMPLKYCSLHSCIAHYANKQTAVIGGSIGMENIDWWNQNKFPLIYSVSHSVISALVWN